VTARTKGSTWVTAFIGCAPPGLGYSPRNCT
jgi:hypothetical protein